MLLTIIHYEKPSFNIPSINNRSFILRNIKLPSINDISFILRNIKAWLYFNTVHWINFPDTADARKVGSSHPRCSVKKVFLEISQNLQENTCGRVSFLIKLHFAKFLRTPSFIEHLWWLLLKCLSICPHQQEHDPALQKRLQNVLF